MTSQVTSWWRGVYLQLIAELGNALRVRGGVAASIIQLLPQRAQQRCRVSGGRLCLLCCSAACRDCCVSDCRRLLRLQLQQPDRALQEMRIHVTSPEVPRAKTLKLQVCMTGLKLCQCSGADWNALEACCIVHASPHLESSFPGSCSVAMVCEAVAACLGVCRCAGTLQSTLRHETTTVRRSSIRNKGSPETYCTGQSEAAHTHRM